MVAAQETAAEIQVDAGVFDLSQTIASLITQTAAGYWKLKAARMEAAAVELMRTSWSGRVL